MARIEKSFFTKEDGSERFNGFDLDTSDDFPSDDVPAPTPWTQEQIEAWNVEHGALKPGEAIAFEAKLKADQKRLSELRGKGAGRMTPQEKDEALDLMLRGAR